MKKKLATIFITLFFVSSVAVAQVSNIVQPAVSQGYALNVQNFFNNAISLPVPSSFVPAEQALINQRFPGGVNVPKIVLTDKSNRPLLALNIAENTGDRTDIVRFYRDMKNDIREKYPTSRFLMTDVIRNRTLAIIEVILPDDKGNNLYNMMAFRYVDNKFFYMNFSCPEDDMGMWQNTAREMAENIKVVK